MPSLSMLLLFVACQRYPESNPVLWLFLVQGIPAAAASPALPGPAFQVFVTSSTVSPYLGIGGFDNECMTDPVKPSGGSTYKAMVVQGTTRRACVSAGCATSGAAEGIDWVLQPSRRYVRATDFAELFTANSAGVFSFGSWQSPPSAISVSFWTGLTASWTNSASHCLSWSNNLAGTYGATGDASATNSAVVAGAALDCTGSYHLLCVEQ